MIVLFLQLGVEDLCQAIEGNFLNMPFQDETFDAAYAIEATCHADKASLWLQLLADLGCRGPVMQGLQGLLELSLMYYPSA